MGCAQEKSESITKNTQPRDPITEIEKLLPPHKVSVKNDVEPDSPCKIIVKMK